MGIHTGKNAKSAERTERDTGEPETLELRFDDPTEEMATYLQTLKREVEEVRRENQELREMLQSVMDGAGATCTTHLGAIIKQGPNAKNRVENLEMVMENLAAETMKTLDKMWTREPRTGAEENAHKLSREIGPNQVLDTKRGMRVLGKSRPTVYKAMEKLGELSRTGAINAEVVTGKMGSGSKKCAKWAT